MTTYRRALSDLVADLQATNWSSWQATDKFAKSLQAAVDLLENGPLPPEPVQRLLRFAGKTRREVRNPCITAREAIVIADWIEGTPP